MDEPIVKGAGNDGAAEPGRRRTNHGARAAHGARDDVAKAWREACDAVIEVASRLRRSPLESGRFGDLLERVHALEKMRESLAGHLEAKRAESLVSSVAEVTTALAEPDAPWLRNIVEAVHMQWKLAWLAGNEIDLNRLETDVERLRVELEDTLNEWRAAEDEKAALREELLRIDEADPAMQAGLKTQLGIDDREADLHGTFAAATKRAGDALRRVLQVVGPAGQVFDPSRDYGREWLDRLASADPGAVVAETEPHSRAGDRPGVAAPPPGDTGGAVGAEAEGRPAVVAAPGLAQSLLGELLGSDVPPPREEADDETAPPRAGENAATVLWQAIREGRTGIAYHVASLSAGAGDADRTLPPADLVAAAALAGHVQSADGAVVKALGPLLARLVRADLSRDDPRLQDALHLMLFCAALRPALFAPRTGAASLLGRVGVSGALTSVSELATLIAGHAQRLQGARLDASMLDATLSPSMWSERFEDLSARALDWRKRAAQQRDLYMPVRRVWADWLSDRGCLGELVGLISSADPGHGDKVRALYERLGDRRRFAGLVRDTRPGRPGGDGGLHMARRVLAQLQARAEPARELAGEWLRLMDAKSGYRTRMHLTAFREELDRYGFSTLAAIHAATRLETSAPLVAALAHCAKSVEAVVRLFTSDDEAEVRRAERNPDAVLSQDLLYVTGLDLDAGLQPAGAQDAARVLDRLLDTHRHAPDMRSACRARLDRGDLIGARLACEHLKAAADPAADHCRAMLDQAVHGRRHTLGEALTALAENIGEAFHLGWLDRLERDRLAGRLVLMRTSIAGANTLERVRAGAVEIDGSIASSRTERAGRANARLDQLRSVDPDGAGHSHVERAIEAGDLDTANRLMDHLDRGEPAVAPAEEGDTFREFLTVAPELEEMTDVTEPAAIVRAVAACKRLGGVSFQTMSEHGAKRAANLLEAWYELSRGGHLDRGTLGKLLPLLGFRVLSTTVVESDPGQAEVTLETETLQDPSLCPLPQFGSAARGRYRIVLNWERPPAETIVRRVGDKGERPTIVLHFGRLGPDRERLRSWAVARRRLFLVVDEPLIVFLSGRRSDRLLDLFRCTLPFSAAEPYATGAGPVPPEQFFGRERARESIMDPHGACFVYGGRLFGKTALLRSVEHDFHDPGAGRLVRWIDLEGWAAGASWPEKIWLLIWHELRTLGVVPETPRKLDFRRGSRVEALMSAMERWLDARGGRRLLLLLDEADAFLELDARADFRESVRLKELMDRTERRFKVVFCGLHKVLRMAEHIGHPLASVFGDPIRVGPLSSQGEWRQAQALVRDPLRAVGYRFEREHLSTCVLALAGGHPLLVRLYGTGLVHRLRGSGRKVPCEIGMEDITAVSRSREIRRASRRCFILNVDLDPRYEVIVYAMAHELLGGEPDLASGLDARTIGELARGWWPEGFDITSDEFGMLLHEMEGLGILRSAQDGSRYMLRNPSDLLLLGNESVIERVLAKDREAPQTLGSSSGAGVRRSRRAAPRREAHP